MSHTEFMDPVKKCGEMCNGKITTQSIIHSEVKSARVTTRWVLGESHSIIYCIFFNVKISNVIVI